MALHKLSLCELQKRFTAGEVTAVEIVRAYALRIGQVESKVKAYVTQIKDVALQRAAELDTRLKGWRKTKPLTGMPLAIKDNLCTEAVPTTCASRMLQHFIPPYDATVVAKLREQDYRLVGNTNLDEFAMGSSTEHSAFGPSRNPWDLHCVPGGSSGGSAAAVAADECVAALGTDTGGSIRQPAAFCGVTGLKQTYGRVSRYGLVAFASSLDQIGPLGHSAADCALLLEVLSGHDPLDSTSANIPTPAYSKTVNQPLQGLKLGLAREYFAAGLNSEIAAAVGATIKEVSMPNTKYGIATYDIIAPSEASSNLARYDGVHYGYRTDEQQILTELAEEQKRYEIEKNQKKLSDLDTPLIRLYRKTRAEGFGPEVKRRIMLGTYTLSAGYYDAYYLKALKVRRLIRGDYDKAFEQVDFVVGPTTPSPPFKIGEKTDDPLSMYLEDLYTVPTNLAGLAGVSIPCGFTKSGLPIGLQMQCRPFDEERLLQAAAMYQKASDWHTKRPALA